MSKIKCVVCGSILESKFRHDRKMCICDNETTINGGDEYFKVSGKDTSKIEVYCDVYKKWVKHRSPT